MLFIIFGYFILITEKITITRYIVQNKEFQGIRNAPIKGRALAIEKMK